MQREPLIHLALLISAFALLNPTVEATAQFVGQRFLTRRQSTSETEKESTTPSTKPAEATTTASSSSTNPNNGQTKPAADRLYPDLARGPNFLPPFNANSNQPNGGQLPPFVPFNTPFYNAAGQRLNADQQQPGPFGPRILAQPRPMTSGERSQSHAFVEGLGKRLLSLVGFHSAANASDASGGGGQGGVQARSDAGAIMPDFQNATLLNELSKRMGMLMSGLSKMYNSTVQGQLNMLQERLQEEAKNGSTTTTAANGNSWQQIMAQRVPAFFNQMATRVNGAQEQLNRAWRELVQVAQGKGNVQTSGQGAPFFAQTNQFFNPNERLDGPPPQQATFFGNQQIDGNNFLQQIGQSLGLNSQQQQQQPQSELAARLSQYWHQQVQPQIGMVRGQVARIWRDLTASGALNANQLRSAAAAASASKNNESNPNGDLVDNLLKEAESESAEFALASGDATSQGKQSNSTGPVLSQQMFNRLMNAQRDLNRVWQGLSHSLQNAVNNAKQMLNPQVARGGQPNQSANQPQAESDQSNNEINDKVRELTKVQQEADNLFNTIQQEQREAQQRQTFADRFRGFVNSVDLRNLNQLPEQIGAQVDRFGRVIGNFWDTIPERWENMRAQRQNQANQAKMEAEIINSRSSTTTKPSSTTPSGQNP